MLAQTYAEARTRFLAAATAAAGRIESVLHSEVGREGEELAMDIVEFGPADATNAVLLVSGTHGVEGFCGSALQSQLLESFVHGGWRGAERLVVVHALNPHGFSWIRRVNEDNIDLNRNFIDWSAPVPINAGYDEIVELLVPPVWTAEEQERTTGALLERAMSLGMDQLQSDVSGGQYAHSTGVFYGGARPAWSNRVLQENVMPRLRSAERVRVIDLHTGLGQNGVGELITSYRPESESFARANAAYGTVTSMYDGSSTSALLTGDWLHSLDMWLPEAEVIGCALEYGTVDPITVLQALRADAWLHAHGDPTAPAAADVRAQVRAAFIDDGPSWLGTVTARFDEVWAQALTW